MHSRPTPVRRRRVIGAALGLMLLAALLWSIGSAFAVSSSPSAAPGGKVILKIGWTTDPDNLNPFVGYSQSSYEVWHLNYNLLVGYDRQHNNPAPELATSWETKGNDWIFHLRTGVTWQDGRPFTAADVVWTYKYIIDNQITTYSTYTKLITDVVALDPNTVEFKCSSFKANMLKLWVPILREDQYAKQDPTRPDLFQQKTPFIGTGPFQTVQVVKNQYVRMVVNPTYWGPKPKIDEVVFETYQDPTTMAEDLKAGTIQGAYGVPIALMPMFQKPNSWGIKGIAYNTAGVDYVSFNCASRSLYPGSTGNRVLLDENFRRALDWAVDKDALLKNSYSGYALKGSTFISPANWDPKLTYHWEPPAAEAYGFDLTKAGDLLTQAGYPLRNGQRLDKHGKPIVLRLWSRSESDSSQSSAKMIAGWWDSLGIKVKLATLTNDALSARLYNTDAKGNMAPDYDTYLWDTIGYADPGDTMASWVTEQIGNWNDAFWSDAQYDALFKKQQSEADPKLRQQEIFDMQKIMYEQSPYIVLAYPDDMEAYNTSHWAGWVRAPQDPLPGGAFYTANNMDTYTSVHMVSGTASSSSSSAWIAVGVVAGVIIVAGAGWLLLRRSRRAAEEE